MDKIKNKKGFTLIELLAVIVILAILILIAATNIGGMLTTARKNVLAVEAETLIKSAQTAYQVDLMDGTIGNANNSVCYSLAYLRNKNYFEKNDGSYHGSVLVKSDGGNLNYYVWVTNGSYSIQGRLSGGFKGKEAGSISSGDNLSSYDMCDGIKESGCSDSTETCNLNTTTMDSSFNHTSIQYFQR